MAGAVIAWLRRLAWVLVALAFAVAGIAKLSDPAAFLAVIQSLSWFPSWLEQLGAAYLPWLELVVAGGLLWSTSRPAASRIAMGLLLGFTLFLLVAAVRGVELTCGCFGEWWVLEGTLWPVVRNLVLIGLLFGSVKPKSAGKSFHNGNE